jgi:hypothetical protein
MISFSTDQNGDGVVNFSDLWAFLTQKVFGFALWILLAVAGGGYYYFFHTNSGRRTRRSRR